MEDIKHKELEIIEEGVEDYGTIEPLNMEEASDKYPNLTIKIDRDQYSIFEMKRRYDKGRIKIDPDFQRNSVWGSKQKSELIESVIMGIPLPLIYLAENMEGELIVVDGRQRLSTFFDFMDSKFALNDLKIIEGINKLRFKDLETDFSQYHSAIEDFQLVVQIIKHPTPDRVRFDIFDRVNRGGTPLNNQEMRNALYQGNATKLLKKLAESECFLAATGYSVRSKRMKDRYIILRALVFSLWRRGELTDIKGKPVEYKSDIEEFLGCGMEFLNRCSEEKLVAMEDQFYKAMQVAFNLGGADIFRIPTQAEKRRPVSMTLFESLFYFVVLLAEHEQADERQVIGKLYDLLDLDETFERALSYNVDSAVQVEERFSAMETLFEETV